MRPQSERKTAKLDRSAVKVEYRQPRFARERCRKLLTEVTVIVEREALQKSAPKIGAKQEVAPRHQRLRRGGVESNIYGGIAHRLERAV